MAFTQAQLDILEQAIALGTTETRAPDGRTVKYRSLGDMMQLRDRMKRELSGTTTPRSSLTIFERE